MNAIVLDLETIPDLSVWTPEKQAEPLPDGKCSKCGEDLPEDYKGDRKCPKMARGKCRPPTDAEKRPPEDEFPPTYAHQIVVLGFCVITDGVPTALQAWTTNEHERSILEAFAGAMASYNDSPQIVTWNGRGFDLPVIELRSLRHGVAQKWYDGQYRGGLWDGAGPNVDLQRILGGHRGGDSYIKLDAACKLIGLPGKPDGMDGSMVRKLVELGNFNTVRAYCLQDVVQTTYLYFRYRLLRGFISREEYVAACTALKGLWSQDPAFADFKVDEGRLL